jgi:hypothetical protein
LVLAASIAALERLDADHTAGGILACVRLATSTADLEYAQRIGIEDGIASPSERWSSPCCSSRPLGFCVDWPRRRRTTVAIVAVHAGGRHTASKSS